MLKQEAAGSQLNEDDGVPRDTPVSRALASLRVIKGEYTVLLDDLIEQCATTLTELDCFQLTCSTRCALPRCTQLESLTFRSWFACPPAAWLGLSQLHTLRGVSLCGVSVPAIAAALPRLNTLHLDHIANVEFPVAVFYDELLPRLRSFRLEGRWPKTSVGREVSDVLPLPRLEDLKWRGDEILPCRFMGARPSTLDSSLADLVEWLNDADGAGADSATATSPFGRMRALTVELGAKPPETAAVAQLLGAAPHLRQLTFDMFEFKHALWVLSESDPILAGVVHSKLRHVAITSKYYPQNSPVPFPVPAGCGVRLRQRHFPRLRLRRLTVDDEEYPVWVPLRVGRKTF
jgi:hypothetical protein